MNAEQNLKEEHHKKLFSVVRTTLEMYLQGESVVLPSIECPELEVSDHGVFVSLHRGKELRGCIGCFSSPKPLWQTVAEFAVASTQDSRFAYNPVTFEELKELQIEISVLSPLRKIENYKQTVLGKHGIMVEKGSNRGVFLPQVATDTGWDLEEFWSQCCSQKAGLSPEAYKDPAVEISIFDAQVFSEH